MTTLFIPTESRAGETRVAATPETVARFVRQGLEVLVERGAGTAASYMDPAYEKAGATLCGPESWGTAEVVAKVQPPSLEEAGRLAKGCILVSMSLLPLNWSWSRRSKRVTSPVSRWT